uniref:Chemokine interleukin-8-like domain-containing protein n=1 Tax=Astatotilapia calliptera TaxID=8154 RepID=A0A3P8P8P6_ASTCA
GDVGIILDSTVHNISKRGGLFLRYSLTFSPGSYGKCCLGYVNDIKKKRNIVGYTMQEPNTVCNMTAVLFQMKKKSKPVCANPDDDWVQREMKRLDPSMLH